MKNFKNKSIPELRKEAYKILKFVKAKGGCLVVHPFRKYKTICMKFNPHLHGVPEAG